MKITLRMWIAILCIVIALVAINPTGYFQKGVIIKSVAANSTAADAGLAIGEIIKEINGIKIDSISDYIAIAPNLTESLKPINWTITADGKEIEYSSQTIGFDVDENLTIISASSLAKESGIEENTVLEEINGKEIETLDDFHSVKTELEPKIKLKIITNKKEATFFASSIDFTVSAIPKTNLKAGLDLSGGSKALIKPEKKLSASEMEDLITVSKERLNVYGIADIVIRPTTDLSGNSYMLVEVAGATPAELKELIGQQGKFEAKIGNETVFIGGKEHIPSVCRNDATCSGVRECSKTTGGYSCRFEFVIHLSEEAAKNQADATSNLSINLTETGDKVLSETLDLYLDDNKVDSLQIDADLKGKAATDISIRGPGTGPTEYDAFKNAEANMKKLQTVLITGSLPFKLEIVKLDSISPVLGKEFVSNILYAALAAALSVALIIFIRYKKLAYTVPILLTVSSELFITLGFAALIRWNLDLASIAGIIAAIGTGVDDQIVILDESETKVQYSLKERIKRAFSIIFGAFATVFVAMIPLWWAGAGMMRGFALTTIAGITIGVMITRPAYAEIVRQIKKD